MSSPESDIRYPRLIRRVQASLFDAVILLSVFFGLGLAFASFEFPGELKAVIFALVVLMLEPGLVSMTGGTIGHHLLGLKIQNRQSGNKLNPVMALVRFLLKSLLGWLSFAFILVTKQRQAIHDKLSGSIVVVRNPTGEEGAGELAEREIYLAEYTYPGWFRRVIVIVLYLIIGFLALVVLYVMVLSGACFSEGHCTPLEGLMRIVSLTFLPVYGAIVLFYGWRGRLFGARRRLRSP